MSQDHECEHCAYLDGFCTACGHRLVPRTWALPVIPEDVTAVSAREGHFIAERDPDLPSYWHVHSVPTGQTYPMITAGMLLHDFGPLTEVVTPTPNEGN